MISGRLEDAEIADVLLGLAVVPYAEAEVARSGAGEVNVQVTPLQNPAGGAAWTVPVRIN